MSSLFEPVFNLLLQNYSQTVIHKDIYFVVVKTTFSHKQILIDPQAARLQFYHFNNQITQTKVAATEHLNYSI